MFCSNCGHRLVTGPYCSVCGSKNDATGIIKPLTTNVGKDESLPRNSNFILTIAFVLFIFSICTIVLGNYIQDNQYYTSFTWNDFVINIPLGFKGEVHKDEGTDHESFLIKSDDLVYELYFHDDEYNQYLNNNYKEVKRFLEDQKYSYTSIDEIDYNNHKLILSILKDTEDSSKYSALYITRIKDTDYMVFGYIYKNGPIYKEDAYKAIDIVDNISRSN